MTQNRKKDKHLVGKAGVLRQKIVKGGLWIFALRVSSRGVGFIRTLILARLLSPNDFGILGVAMLMVGIFETLSQTGYQAALIQRQEDEITPYLDTAWTISVLRGMFLFLVVYAAAPMVSGIFDSPDAEPIMRLVAVSTMVAGFINSGIIAFERDIDFKRQYLYEISAVITDVALSIILALSLKNAWALAWAGLAANVVRVAMSYVLHPYRPRLRFDTDKWNVLFRFGKWVFISNLLIFIVTRGDDLLVGKLLGTRELGLYQMAYLISNLPTTEITHVVARLMFPVYARIQEDKRLFKETYEMVLGILASITIPLSTGIFLLSEPFVNIFLGEKWYSMIPAIQILSFAGLSRSLAAAGGAIFFAVGKPNIDTALQMARAFILIATIYPLTNTFGINGASLSTLLSISTVMFGFVLISVRIANIPYKNLLKILLTPIFCSSIMGLCIILLKQSVPILKPQYFIFTFVQASIIYIVLIGVFSRKLIREIWAKIKTTHIENHA